MGLKLFRDHTGARRVRFVSTPAVSTEPVSYFTNQAGTTSAAVSVPKVMPLASVSADQQELYVLLTNTTADEPVTFSVSTLAPFEVGQLRSVKRVVSPGPAVTNTVANPTAISIADVPLPTPSGGVVTLDLPPTSVTALRFVRP